MCYPANHRPLYHILETNAEGVGLAFPIFVRSTVQCVSCSTGSKLFIFLVEIFINIYWWSRMARGQRSLHDIIELTRILAPACDFVDYATTCDTHSTEVLLNVLTALSNSAPYHELLHGSRFLSMDHSFAVFSEALCFEHAENNFINSDQECFERLFHRLLPTVRSSIHSVMEKMLLDIVFVLSKSIRDGTITDESLECSFFASRIGSLMREGADPCALTSTFTHTMCIFLENFSTDGNGRKAISALSIWFRSLAIVGVNINSVALHTWRIIDQQRTPAVLNLIREALNDYPEEAKVHAFESVEEAKLSLLKAYQKCGMLYLDDTWYIPQSLKDNSGNTSGTDFVPSTMYSFERTIPTLRRGRAFEAD